MDPRMHRILYLLNITFLKDKKHNCRTGFVLNIFNILNHLIPGCNLFCNIVPTIITIQYAEKNEWNKDVMFAIEPTLFILRILM